MQRKSCCAAKLSTTKWIYKKNKIRDTSPQKLTFSARMIQLDKLISWYHLFISGLAMFRPVVRFLFFILSTSGIASYKCFFDGRVENEMDGRTNMAGLKR